VDTFQAQGLRCWGPSKAAAKLEGSKVEMKEFLRRHGIPTAQFKVFTKVAEAHAYIDELAGGLVVKADGLAAGKSVVVAKTPAEAHDAVDRIMVKHEFGAEAGRAVVLEDFLRGEEISVFAFCDGRNAVMLDLVQDHKQLGIGISIGVGRLSVEDTARSPASPAPRDGSPSGACPADGWLTTRRTAW